MATLTLEELKNYEKWIGKSAHDVLESVKSLDGKWADVFKEEVYPWANLVRNYFNVAPAMLTLLDKKSSKEKTKNLNKHRFYQDFWMTDPLNGDVYLDSEGNPWYQMRPWAAWEHTGRKAFVQQEEIDVFKLVSPDGTGGSREICISNFKTRLEFGGLAGTQGKKTVGPVGQEVNVRYYMITDGVYQGTYNYAESIVKGPGAHTKMDYSPHKSMSGTYVKVDPFSSLHDRKFERLTIGTTIKKPSNRPGSVGSLKYA